MPEVAPARVSVIVPTRGRPELLREALASIRAVESPALSLEILVCDNGNGEGEAPAREYGARYLPVNRPRAAAARNDGMRAATGEFLAFLDDDDIWLPNHLAPHVAMLQARPELAAVVGQTVTTDEARHPAPQPFPRTLPADGDVFEAFLGQYPQIGSTVIRKQISDLIGPQDEADAVDGDEDWDWHLRLALGHRVGFVQQTCVLFRQRAAGTSDRLQWKRLWVMRRVLFRTLMRAGSRRPSLGVCLRTALRHHGGYAWSFLQSARQHVATGDQRAAWRAVMYAFASSPVHTALELVRPSGTGRLLPALVLG